jgi:hypothetical protein
MRTASVKFTKPEDLLDSIKYLLRLNAEREISAADVVQYICELLDFES